MNISSRYTYSCEYIGLVTGRYFADSVDVCLVMQDGIRVWRLVDVLKNRFRFMSNSDDWFRFRSVAFPSFIAASAVSVAILRDTRGVAIFSDCF